MKKLFIVIIVLFSPFVHAGEFMKNTVPHYYQMDGNPSNVWACGHAVLKSVGKYITGSEKSLSSLHKTLWYNDPIYRSKLCDGKYCARLYDLYNAAKLSQNGGYGKINSVLRPVTDYSTLLNKVKDGVINDLPLIAESRWDISYGHFYVIVGYEDTGNSATSLLYLRDVLKPYPLYEKYDTFTTVKNFHDNMQDKQVLFMKRGLS